MRSRVLHIFTMSSRNFFVFLSTFPGSASFSKMRSFQMTDERCCKGGLLAYFSCRECVCGQTTLSINVLVFVTLAASYLVLRRQNV